MTRTAKNPGSARSLRSFRLGSRTFDPSGKKYVMAILNVTPDSFYDGGRYPSKKKLTEAVTRLGAEGADIIDIGGESTRPGSRGVTAEEELRRVLTAFEICRKKAPAIPLSIDTTKSAVAEALLKEGAEMINDVSGFTFDPAMAEVCGRYSAAVVLMHIRGKPGTMQSAPRYPKGVVAEVKARLLASARTAHRHGISRVIVDPGIGFGKTVSHNYALLDGLDEIAKLGYPVLVGVSRKSLIGRVLDRPAEKRLAATMALDLVALLNGASFIRVHDTAEGRDTVRLWEQFDIVRRKERT